MEIADLPHVNVTLNASSAILVTAGFIAVKSRRIRLHKGLMLSALTCTLLFFVSYIIYHINIGSKPYTGVGGWRTVYFAILISHVTLAAVNLPMVIVTAYRALTNQIAKHRRIARITLPIWWYVSVTGVIVYIMLY